MDAQKLLGNGNEEVRDRAAQKLYQKMRLLVSEPAAASRARGAKDLFA